LSKTDNRFGLVNP